MHIRFSTLAVLSALAAAGLAFASERGTAKATVGGKKQETQIFWSAKV